MNPSINSTRSALSKSATRSNSSMSIRYTSASGGAAGPAGEVIGCVGVIVDIVMSPSILVCPIEWYTVSREESPRPTVGVFGEPLAVFRVLGGDQRFEQPEKVTLDPLSKHEAVVAGELTRVVARTANQVVSPADHDQFLVFFH